MSVKFFGLKEIHQSLNDIDKNLHPAIIRDATEDAFQNVRKRAEKHYKTGNMENNISFKVRKTFGEVYIEDNGMLVDYKGKKINYATFVLYGTRPHDIKPDKKKALRFSSVGDFVFTKLVHHPGYKGDNFLHDGVQDTFKKLDNIINKVVKNELS